MTVIAYDGKTISADKRGDDSGLCRTVTKLFRLADNSIVAISGSLGGGLVTKKWIEDGADKENYPECQTDDNYGCACIHVKDGVLKVYGALQEPMIYEDKLMAWGSGRDYALAAMHCGKSTADAVEIACLYESGCGNGVDTMEITK